MSQHNNIMDKSAAMAAIEKINEVSGFDPKPLAVEYTDLNNSEKRMRLPVMAQIAWFRLKYPEGKITVQVTPARDCFVATARIYPSYKDSVDCYLSEATASRGYLSDKPSVSPREWAQTAAVGIALRNAGFGLQFAAAGAEFEDIAPDELGITGNVDNTQSITDTTTSESNESTAPTSGEAQKSNASDESESYTVDEVTKKEMTFEDALQVKCPITKYRDMPLSEVLAKDPSAINWLATKYSNDDDIKKAAIIICEYSINHDAA